MGDIKQWRDNTKGIETFLKLFTKRNERIAKSLREKAIVRTSIVHQKPEEGGGQGRNASWDTKTVMDFGGNSFHYVLKYSQSGFYKI